MSLELEGVEIQAVKDLKSGVRLRKLWKKIVKAGAENGLSEDQIRGYINGNGIFATDAERKVLATNLGFDWEGAANFFATIAPIIIQMMAACGA